MWGKISKVFTGVGLTVLKLHVLPYETHVIVFESGFPLKENSVYGKLGKISVMQMRDVHTLPGATKENSCIECFLGLKVCSCACIFLKYLHYLSASHKF